VISGTLGSDFLVLQRGDFGSRRDLASHRLLQPITGMAVMDHRAPVLCAARLAFRLFRLGLVSVGRERSTCWV